MLFFLLLNLFTISLTEQQVIVEQEIFPISHPDELDLYCQNLIKVKLTNHRPHLRQTRATNGFSVERIQEFNDVHWREMLGEKFDYRCEPREFVPRRREQLKDYPEMTCHNLCRACFQDSLPVCLRRHLDNNFGLTCYCSYDTSAPVLNHTFKIHD